MIKIKIIIATLISILSIQSQAALNGRWTGYGDWRFKGEGEGAHCNPMTLNLSETAKSFSMNSGYFDCGIVGMEILPLTWKLENQKLFDENNIEVGTYDGFNLFVELPQPNPNTRIHVKISRVANHFDYQEVWFNETEKVYVIDARFFTSGN